MLGVTVQTSNESIKDETDNADDDWEIEKELQDELEVRSL